MAKSDAEEVRRLREKHHITSAAARQILAGQKLVGVNDEPEGDTQEDEWFHKKEPENPTKRTKGGN